MSIVEATPERAVVVMPVSQRHLQPWGYLHGGASVALAETAATSGAFLACPPGMAAFGLEINANHVRPMRTGTLTATATPRHIGRTTHIWDVTIVDEGGRIICLSRCTLAIIPAAEDSAEPKRE